APQFSTSVFRNTTDAPTTNVVTGTGLTLNNGSFSTGTTLNQTLPWGGAYTANWSNSRATSTDPSQLFNPRVASSINLNYTQPLLRNRDIDQIRQQVKSSQKGRELSDIQLQYVITGTMRAVKNAYWDLSYAIANLKAQQQSLALSQQSLRDNQRRVEIGTM